VATGIPLSQAIGEYLSWLELDRDGSQRTTAPQPQTVVIVVTSIEAPAVDRRLRESAA
jgi:hypothetical protein